MNNRIEIASQLRPCIVHTNTGTDARALFHRWEQWYDTTVPIGEAPGGQRGEVYGIVELENGRTGRAQIGSIRFLDSPFEEYDFTENKEDE